MMRSIASMPFMTGRCRSISTAAGRSLSTIATASRPLRASPTTIIFPSAPHRGGGPPLTRLADDDHLAILLQRGAGDAALHRGVVDDHLPDGSAATGTG